MSKWEASNTEGKFTLEEIFINPEPNFSLGDNRFRADFIKKNGRKYQIPWTLDFRSRMRCMFSSHSWPLINVRVVSIFFDELGNPCVEYEDLDYDEIYIFPFDLDRGGTWLAKFDIKVNKWYLKRIGFVEKSTKPNLHDDQILDGE